jgi:hypothetical protein
LTTWPTTLGVPVILLPAALGNACNGNKATAAAASALSLTNQKEQEDDIVSLLQGRRLASTSSQLVSPAKLTLARNSQSRSDVTAIETGTFHTFSTTSRPDSLYCRRTTCNVAHSTVDEIADDGQRKLAWRCPNSIWKDCGWVNMVNKDSK